MRRSSRAARWGGLPWIPRPRESNEREPAPHLLFERDDRVHKVLVGRGGHVGRQVVAQSIHDFFATKENKKLIERLDAHGVTMKQEKRRAAGPKPLGGKTIVVTGTLENYTRESIQERIHELGGKPTSSVSKKTDYVLVGDSPGSKADKAKELGIKIIDEKEFEKLAKEV